MRSIILVRIFCMSRFRKTTDHLQRDDNHATAACESSLFISRCSITRRTEWLTGISTGWSLASISFRFADYSD